MLIDTNKLKRLLKSQGFTQTALAQAAGLSRPALHAILRQKTADVRLKTLQGLARALRLGDEGFLLEDPLAVYKGRVASAHATLDFHRLALTQTDPLNLEDLYVRVRLRAALSAEEDACGKGNERPSQDEEH